MSATQTQARGYRKVREGLVVSDKMNKTVVVAVEDCFKHPMYGKVVRRTSKLKAHDEQNSAGVGDRVLLIRGEVLDKSPFPKADLPTEGPFTTLTSIRGRLE